MIRLGVRFSLSAGRESAVRLMVTAVAVALGVALLLVTAAGVSALRASDRRSAWLNTSANNVRPSGDERTVDPLWGAGTIDEFAGKAIDRVDVAATGPRSPVPPGIPRLPRAGEYYASPALTRLLRTTPADQLADRYPGRQVGTIDDVALASPGSLVIIVGRTVDELSHLRFAAQLRSFETAASGSSPFNHHPGRMQLILAVVAGALLFPVLIFISTATRLAAAQREQRFAAMRLVGATPRQVALLSAVEAFIAAGLGVVVGFAVFFAARPAFAKVPFTGEPFFPADLTLTMTQTVLVAVGIPVAAAIVAMLALRRVDVSPLGVSRRVPGRAPRAWRVIPLLAGIAELAYFVGVGRPGTTGGQISAYGAGFLLSLVGLLVAGPWLTMAGSRLMAARANRPAMLIAGRRLSANPKAAFRSVSGLIVALFITTTALGVINTIVGYHDGSTGGNAGRRLIAEDFLPDPIAALPSGLVERLSSTRGVRGVVVVRADPSFATGPEMGPPPGLASCADLAHIPSLGRCEPGAAVVRIPWINGSGMKGFPLGAGAVRHAVAVSRARLQTSAVRSLYVDTDGSTAAIERVRTALEVTLPRSNTYIGPPSTLSEISPDAHQQLTGYQRLAAVAILASLPIAACSLAVSVASGLTDRKRPFSLLRLAGTPLAVLRRVVAMEAAVPLVVVSILSAGTGLVAADLFLRAQLEESLRPPGGGYYGAVAIALAAALGIIAATLPLLDRITGPEVARNE